MRAFQPIEARLGARLFRLSTWEWCRIVRLGESSIASDVSGFDDKPASLKLQT
jgi:hypothetical protein